MNLSHEEVVQSALDHAYKALALYERMKSMDKDFAEDFPNIVSVMRSEIIRYKNMSEDLVKFIIEERRYLGPFHGSYLAPKSRKILYDLIPSLLDNIKLSS